MKRDPVAVLGGGAWGVMLAQLLSLNFERVPLWVRDADLREELEGPRTHRGVPGLTLSERVSISGDLAETARGAELLILAVPSQYFREVARGLGGVVQGDQMLVSGAKGLEEGTADRMSEILQQETCVRMVGALGGPTYVEDLGRGSPGAAVIGSHFDAVISRTQACLASERLRIWGNRDLLGVELGGALATAIIMVCGIAEGLQLGPAIKAVVINRGLKEVSDLGRAMGALPGTFQGLSAMGDVMAAAFSGESRDFKIGLRLAKGDALPAILETLGPAECVSTTRMAIELAGRNRIDLPLIGAISRVLFEGLHPRDVIRGLMTRKAVLEAS